MTLIDLRRADIKAQDGGGGPDLQTVVDRDSIKHECNECIRNSLQNVGVYPGPRPAVKGLLFF